MQIKEAYNPLRLGNEDVLAGKERDTAYLCLSEVHLASFL
jgi:hypothetical protein